MDSETAGEQPAMTTSALVWQGIPPAETLASARQLMPHAVCVFLCDDFSGSLASPQTGYLKKPLSSCAAGAANFISANTSPVQCDIYLLPVSAAGKLRQYGFGELHWQNCPPEKQQAVQTKPWQVPPPPQPIGQVLIVGGGIAGAATAYALARRGIGTIILEQRAQPAQAGSGNRQGLLYAKISANPTLQTRLLLGSYGFSRRLLEHTMPHGDWQACGVLHLNHNESEHRRNRQLAQQTINSHLYRAVSAGEAANLAGIALDGKDGLFWPQGAWLHPPAWADALLSLPAIRLLTRHHITALQRDQVNGTWQLYADTPQGKQIFSGSHIIFCCGAEDLNGILPYPLLLQFIRGQTSLAAATPSSRKLRCALSADAYISPVYRDQHCFGASFVSKSRDSRLIPAEDRHNHQKLTQLSSGLADTLSVYRSGHAAIRADCYDHLPAVGALGDWTVMKHQYAKLAVDKNYRLPHQACPYLPGLFVNTGHGSRGLATAPLCGELLAAQILGLPLPAEPEVALALAPNRLLVRQIIRRQSATSPLF